MTVVPMAGNLHKISKQLTKQKWANTILTAAAVAENGDDDDVRLALSVVDFNSGEADPFNGLKTFACEPAGILHSSEHRSHRLFFVDTDEQPLVVIVTMLCPISHDFVCAPTNKKSVVGNRFGSAEHIE